MSEKTRLVRVQITAYKVFYVETPEGVSESEVLESMAVEDESENWGDVDWEVDEIDAREYPVETPAELESMRKNEKIFSWAEACGDE